MDRQVTNWPCLPPSPKHRRRRRGKEDDNNDGGDDGGGGVVEVGGRGGDDDWQRVAISITTSAARGVEGYHVADDWTLRCRLLLLHPDDNGDDNRARRQSIPVDGTADFGEALKSLPVRECYRSRLANALDALDSVARSMPLLCRRRH